MARTIDSRVKNKQLGIPHSWDYKYPLIIRTPQYKYRFESLLKKIQYPLNCEYPSSSGTHHRQSGKYASTVQLFMYGWPENTLKLTSLMMFNLLPFSKGEEYKYCYLYFCERKQEIEVQF